MFETKKQIKLRLIESFGKVKKDTFYFESIEKYFRNKDNTGSFQILSDKTCNDLDFNELFMFLDRTTSKVGQQFLYNTLRTIPLDRDRFTEQENLIEQITKAQNLRLKIQVQLDKLSKDSSYFITSLFQDKHIEKPKWFFIIPLLALTSLSCFLLLSFEPRPRLRFAPSGHSVLSLDTVALAKVLLNTTGTRIPLKAKEVPDSVH